MTKQFCRLLSALLITTTIGLPFRVALAADVVTGSSAQSKISTVHSDVGGTADSEDRSPASPADEFEFVLTGSIRLFEQRLGVRDLAVANGLAIAAADSLTGLAVIDVSDPDSVVLIGRCRVPGVPLSVDLIGNFALVGTMAAGLQVVDIANPAEPLVVQSLPVAHAIWDVLVHDSLAYLSATSLVIVNCVNPLAPTVVAEFVPASGSARHCAIDGSHGFLSLGYSGLEIINIADPAVPFHVTTYFATAKTEAITLRGDYAYLAAGDFGMVIVNIADVYYPFNVGACETGSQAVDIAVLGNYAYLANDSEGLRVINIGNPSMPFNVGAYDVISGTEAVVINQNQLYLGDSRGLIILSLSNPQQPPFVAQVTSYSRAADATALSLGGDGYLACITSYSGEVSCYDFSNPTDPAVWWQFETPGEAWKAIATDNRSAFFVADGSAGLYVRHAFSSFEVRVPMGECYGIARLGSQLYLGAGPGLVIVDAADLFNPVIVSTLSLPGVPGGLCVRDSLLYVAVWNAGLQVINVKTPEAPVIIGSCPLPGTINDVVLQGKQAFLACGLAGLCIVDISNPSAPQLISQFDTPGWAASLDVSGPWVLVADWNEGAVAVQVQTPSQPRFGGHLDTDNTVAVALREGKALVLSQRDLYLAETATCGDVRVDCLITVSDVVALINFLYGGFALPSGARPDVDGDGAATVTDAVYIINYIFAGGPAPCAIRR